MEEPVTCWTNGLSGKSSIEQIEDERDIQLSKSVWVTYQDYRHGIGTRRIRCWARRSCLWKAADWTLCAKVLAYRDREHAWDWSFWRSCPAIFPYRSRWKRIRANGTDAKDWVVVLKGIEKNWKPWRNRYEIGEIRYRSHAARTLGELAGVPRTIDNEEIVMTTKIGKDEMRLNVPSSTSTTSTMALWGMSTLWVHMQLAPQSAGLLSPLQNCSGGISSIWESGGAGGKVKDISSTKEMTWSPVGATA